LHASALTLLALVLASAMTAQDRRVQTIVARKQPALVIGNTPFTSYPTLANLLNDARRVAGRFQQLNYDVWGSSMPTGGAFPNSKHWTQLSLLRPGNSCPDVRAPPQLQPLSVVRLAKKLDGLLDLWTRPRYAGGNLGFATRGDFIRTRLGWRRRFHTHDPSTDVPPSLPSAGPKDGCKVVTISRCRRRIQPRRPSEDHAE
jgi:hypothetical protein